MAQTAVYLAYSSDIDISIPANAANLVLYVGGASGAIGGNDAGMGSLGSGVGRAGVISLGPNYVARNLALRMGRPGQAGTTGTSGSKGVGGNGGAAGAAAGGRGSNDRANRWSGGGGGGGGASGVYDGYYNTWICVAGGGGGGGGGSLNRVGGAGTNAGDWGASGGFGPSNGGGYGTGREGGDGGGGGGGGGGAPGGGAGGMGTDESVSSGGGAGGGSLYNSSVSTLLGSGTSGDGYVHVQYTLVTPTIDSFTANPNPQTSGLSGIPSYSTTLSWTTTDAQSVTLSENGAVAADGSRTVSNLPQSVAGSNSPASKTYTLTACTGGVCVSRTITVSVYNDNNPPAFTIPNQTNLEPNQSYIINVGTIGSSVIDMVTGVTGLNGATVSKNNTNSWTTTMTIDPNNSVQVRFFSLGFNQSPEGLTNSTTYGVTIGTQTAYFTATTRAPDVNETFNLPNESDRVPYPDIDTIDEPSEEYIVSNTLSVDDIELQNPSGVEIRTNNGNAQIRKKITGTSTWGSWQDVRSI